MEHTPTPWAKDYGGTTGHIKSIAPRTDKGTPTICHYDDCAASIYHQAEANAAFIVTCCNERAEIVAGLRKAEDALAVKSSLRDGEQHRVQAALDTVRAILQRIEKGQ
jgi:hypothetical protein